MNVEQKGIYISYFRRFATPEQIGDISDCSVDVICEYILEIGKVFYEEKSKNSLNIHSKWLKSNEINYLIFS